MTRDAKRSARAGGEDAGVLVRHLKRDHRTVLRAVKAVERDLAHPRRGPIRGDREARLRAFLAMLGSQFASHLLAEDEVLLPALAEALPAVKAFLAPLHAEHADLRAMRDRLERTLEEAPSSARDEEIVVQMKDLAELLRIHIRKEETAVLGVAARLLGPPEIAAVWKRMGDGAAPRSGSRQIKASTKGVS